MNLNVFMYLFWELFASRRFIKSKDCNSHVVLLILQLREGIFSISKLHYILFFLSMVLLYKFNWGLDPGNECCINSDVFFLAQKRRRVFDLISLLLFIKKKIMTMHAWFFFLHITFKGQCGRIKLARRAEVIIRILAHRYNLSYSILSKYKYKFFLGHRSRFFLFHELIYFIHFPPFEDLETILLTSFP